MTTIFLVKSGQNIDFVGWEWTNLKVFDNEINAINYASEIELQIRNDELEAVEIEEFTLE